MGKSWEQMSVKERIAVVENIFRSKEVAKVYQDVGIKVKSIKPSENGMGVHIVFSD